ncbi:MAG: outer membrane protein [Xanthobacteraceae bacterium]
MLRGKLFGLAGAAALLSTAAIAADLPPPLPPPMYRAPVVVEGGWYLRGDVGVGAQSFKDFAFTQTNYSGGFVWPASWRIDQKDMKSATFAGFGIGYAWNNWLRFDFTGEYRANVPFKALGSYTEFCPGGRCFDAYDGNHSAWVTMVNAYVDLGTWWCLTPFVGLGVGSAYHTVHSVTDVGYITGPGTTGFGYASQDSFSKWNLAWAAHAGVAYNVSSSFKVELAYRYLNMGNVQTGIVDCSGFTCSGGGPRAYYTMTNFESHDLRIGLRFMLQPEAPLPYPPPPPLIRKG